MQKFRCSILSLRNFRLLRELGYWVGVSESCTEQSRGTAAFITDFLRLIDSCLVRTSEEKFDEAREAFKSLFDLLARIDGLEEDILLFADEGGSYEVGVDWRLVLPAWFTCLAATATPIEFAHEAVVAIDTFDRFRREEHLISATVSGVLKVRRNRRNESAQI